MQSSTPRQAAGYRLFSGAVIVGHGDLYAKRTHLPLSKGLSLTSLSMPHMGSWGEEIKEVMEMDPLTVMLVDDEEDFLDTLVKRLRKRNVNAIGARSGEEALDTLKKNEVDVVVLDVKMPGMDGIETLKEIRTYYPLSEVIMLTGHASLEVAIEGMELGAFDYLMKPIEIDELLFKVQDAYKKKSIHAEKMRRMKELSATGE